MYRPDDWPLGTDCPEPAVPAAATAVQFQKRIPAAVWYSLEATGPLPWQVVGLAEPGLQWLHPGVPDTGYCQ